MEGKPKEEMSDSVKQFTANMVRAMNNNQLPDRKKIEEVRSAKAVFKLSSSAIKDAQKPTIDELLKASDYSHPQPTEEREWIDAPSAGDELI